MSIILTKEELKKLLKCNDDTGNVPVMALSVADGLAGRDFASLARNDLMEYWEEVGKKHEFNPEDVRGIKRETGEVLL